MRGDGGEGGYRKDRMVSGEVLGVTVVQHYSPR